MKRGYFGIALWEPKTAENIGSVMRNAGCFGADFVALIGARYPRKFRTDTQDASKHIPLLNFDDLESFFAAMPDKSEIVAVEFDAERTIRNFHHPERAIYLFGGEDRTLPPLPGKQRIKLETEHCLNMAVTTGLVMFHRSIQTE